LPHDFAGNGVLKVYSLANILTAAVRHLEFIEIYQIFNCGYGLQSKYASQCQNFAPIGQTDAKI